MNRLADLLRSSPLLLPLSEERITALVEGARLVQLPLGQALQRAGQLPSGAALLLEGRLRRLLAKPGGSPWNLGFVEPGEWLGWSALWRNEPELTLIASRPSTRSPGWYETPLTSSKCPAHDGGSKTAGWPYEA